MYTELEVEKVKPGDGRLPIEFFTFDRETPQQTPDDTFEIGLTLAGTVSAAAYTGGALDFLFEAMDRWETAKREHPDSVPDHKVILHAISGTSGGGMCAALVAAYADRDFARADIGALRQDNPFYEGWVNRIGMEKLLETSDLEDSDGRQFPLLSILDATVLDEIARTLLEAAARTPRRARGWIADPLRVLITLGNVRGIPYWRTFAGNTSAGNGMRAGADHRRFAAVGSGAPAGVPPRADETILELPGGREGEAWTQLRQTGLATGAFPFGLAPRRVQRRYADYDARVSFKNLKDERFIIRPSRFEGADNYAFVAVDGGVFDNEPMELVRRVLSGIDGRNPREGTKARRAVLMIDAFPEPPELGPDTVGQSKVLGIPLLGLVGDMFNSWIDQARFNPEDLALAYSEGTYSRFLVSPTLKNVKFPLACGALGGFGGFLHRDFRLHDYVLGRRNMQRFLQKYFKLPRSNTLFASWRDRQELFEKFRLPGTEQNAEPHLPIIPVGDPAAGNGAAPRPRHILDSDEIEPRPRPVGKFQFKDIEPGVRRRFDAVLRAAASDQSVGRKTLILAAGRLFRGQIVGGIRSVIEDALAERGLLSR